MPRDLEQLAQEALASLPAPFRAAAQDVAINVAEWPARDMLEELGITDPLELTGLYDGVPLPLKSVSDQPQAPDAIWLFRQPILAEWRERGNVDLAELVAHVLVHELAHHFGWTDDDIAAVDPWWE